MDPQPLKGKNAIVTGAARGIGRAIAQRLAAEGAQVAILDIDADGAQQTAAEIGGSTIGLAVDVAQAASVDRAFAQVADQLGGLDILVNNAGIVGTDTPVKDLSRRRLGSRPRHQSQGNLSVLTGGPALHGAATERSHLLAGLYLR